MWSFSSKLLNHVMEQLELVSGTYVGWNPWISMRSGLGESITQLYLVWFNGEVSFLKWNFALKC